jgi:sodium transport system permease protein
MKNKAIITVFKKELARFFTDRRTLLALLLPGLLIYMIYSVMGSTLEGAFSNDKDQKHQIVAVNMPESIETLLKQQNAVITPISKEEVDGVKEGLKNGEGNILAVFPADFDEAVALYTSASGTAAPAIEIYYNSSTNNSSSTYSYFTALLNNYESMLSNKFDINVGDGVYNLASKVDTTAKVFSMMLPMLLMMLLFSGCMAVAPESIAGEKERGTIATMLVTPVKRNHIAIGKILALSVMALMSGASSTIGVLLSLPKLMGGNVELDGSVYTVSDYLLLAAVILSTVLLLITVVSVISAYAKTIKEATTFVTPLMIVSTLVGLSGMSGVTASSPSLYLIPFYNSVQSMIGIFSLKASIINIVITIVMNLVISIVGVVALTKMFDNEKIMFN